MSLSTNNVCLDRGGRGTEGVGGHRDGTMYFVMNKYTVQAVPEESVHSWLLSTASNGKLGEVVQQVQKPLFSWCIIVKEWEAWEQANKMVITTAKIP